MAGYSEYLCVKAYLTFKVRPRKLAEKLWNFKQRGSSTLHSVRTCVRRERERERVCVCVCVCAARACACVFVYSCRACTCIRGINLKRGGSRLMGFLVRGR